MREVSRFSEVSGGSNRVCVIVTLVVGAICLLFPQAAVAQTHNINPSAPTGSIINLPGPGDQPVLNDLDGAPFVQNSTTNFTVIYNLHEEDASGAWDGIMVRWDDWGSRDLSSITTFVFGVTGTPNNIKVEFEATNSVKTIFNLLGVTNTIQNYHIPASLVTNVDDIKVISFVVDLDLAGPDNTNGSFSVFVGGIKFDWSIVGNGSGTPTVMPNLPDVIPVGGANGDTVVVNTNASLIEVSYNVETGGWSGATILYDNYGTPATNESQDLSGYSDLVFGLYGDPAQVKIEFLDHSNKVMFATATNIESTVKYYSVDTWLLTNDLQHMRMINFVVDNPLSGAGNETGFAYIVSGGLDYTIEIDGAGSGAATVLPDEPTVVTVGGANGDTVVSQTSTSMFSVVYDVTTGGWAGATILWDDYGTAPIEYTDLSGYSSLVIAFTGTPERISMEVLDTNGVQSAATLVGTDTGTYKYYTVELSHFSNKGVNLSRTRMINFVVDAAKAGSGKESGSFGVLSAGLFYALTVGGEASATLTTLPENTQGRLGEVIVVGGANGDTSVTRPDKGTINVTYNVSTGGYAGATILFDDYGTGPNESADLSSFTSIVFRLRGDPCQLKFEFEDAVSNKVVGAYTNVTAGWQYFQVPTSELSNRNLDLTQVRFINFVVDENTACGNDIGGFAVYAEGLGFQFTPVASPTGPATVLPNEPTVIVVGGANGDTTVVNTNSTLIGLTYNVTTGGYAGTTILYDDYGTPSTIEYQDLSGLGSLVFGLRGDPSNVKIEFQDASNRVMVANCTGVTASVQYYQVATALFTNDITQIAAINFVVDQNLAGAGNYSGDAFIISGGLDYPFDVSASTTGTVSVMPTNNQGRISDVIVVGGANGDTVVERPDVNTIKSTYNVSTGGYAGATILFDDYGTGPNESANFSGFTTVVFRIKGDPCSLKFEFEDATSNKVTGAFTGLSSSWQTYQIPTQELEDKGLDLTAVRFINFVVDENTTCGTDIGTFEVYVEGLYYKLTIGALGSGPATVLPNEPSVITLGGANGDTVVSNPNSALINVTYNVVTGGFAGATILYDDYGTSGTVESQDLSGYANLVFGFSGDPGNVKIEFQDASNRVMVAVCTGVTSSVQYYSVPTAEFTNDVTKIAAISFVIDQGLAEVGNYSGSLAIQSGGLNQDLTVSGTGAGTLSQYPAPAPDLSVVGGANGDTILEQYSSNEFKVIYNVTTGGWSGASVVYDDFGTGPVESGDLSAFTGFVIMVRGDVSSLQFEFQDADTNTVAGALTGVSTSWQYYSLPVDEVNTRGVDVTNIALISFVVTSDLAGSGNENGYFEVETRGLNFANPAYERKDSDGDGLPDDWEEAHGLDPNDDGSTNPDNGADGDPDHDGVTNSGELYGGTDPQVYDSRPTLDIGKSGSNILLTADGKSQRIYRFYRSMHLITGKWEYVTSANLATSNVTLNVTDDDGLSQAYYKFRVTYSANSPLPGNPEVIVTGGANGDTTVLTQNSTRQFTLQYNVVTGYAGATITFDNYGTVPIESANLSGYDFLAFSISGTPAHVKYEVEDAAANKAVGTLRYVSGTMTPFKIDTAWLTASGVDITQVRSISFIVDSSHASPGTVGSFSVETYGLSYTPQVGGQGSGSATALLSPSPTVYDLGGANTSANWGVIGGTNIWINYNVSTGGWDGVTISHDDFGSEPIESADYSALSDIVFGAYGDPDKVKVEVQDVLNNVALVVFTNVTGSQQFFSISVADLEDIGLDVSRIRMFNFVVDQGMAGAGNHAGAFSVVTDGLLP